MTDRYKEEFPDFKLDVAVPDGFEDVSWHNDTCPCFLNRELDVFLFVDYAHPDTREFPDADRFTLLEADGGMHVQDPKVYLTTSDWAAVLAAIGEMEPAAVRKGRPAGNC